MGLGTEGNVDRAGAPADMTCLLISVRLLDARYHGAGDWPPAPARLFQALLSGAARGRQVAAADLAALAWLEAQAAPLVAAPPQSEGQAVSMFVPNNDLDAVGGDARRIGTIRTQKMVKPRLLPRDPELLYAWNVPVGPEAERVTALANGVYQLGRGLDMAWAVGEVVDAAGLAARLGRYEADGGRVYRPSAGDGDVALACPQAGSLASLQARFDAFGERFSRQVIGKKPVTLFTQPPKARFQQVTYASPGVSRIYELQGDGGAFEAWPLARAHDLVTAVRDGAYARLVAAMPGFAAALEAALIGRGAAASVATRVRIVPLPSVGHVEADPAIRRVLVTTPADCALDAGDVHWALSGLEIAGRALTPSDDDAMLGHYGRDGARRWTTVTAAALPEQAARRRIAPGRPVARAEVKSGGERAHEEALAHQAVMQALRHAGVGVRATRIAVQREPFDKRGARAEAFAPGTRFAKERLWHVEIELERAVRGPLVLGDGRFLGLGVMRAVRDAAGLAVFGVEGVGAAGSVVDVTRALRRAVMARVGQGKQLPRFFSGHEGDDAPAVGHGHLAYVYDRARERVLIVAPHVLGHGKVWRDEASLARLEAALDGLREVRMGASGCATLVRRAIDVAHDPLLRAGCVWESATPYLVTRHAKVKSAAAALAANIQDECALAGLPRPRVEVIDTMALPGLGVSGRARLHFAVAQVGPILLGRSRHLGGGLFEGVQ